MRRPTSALARARAPFIVVIAVGALVETGCGGDSSKEKASPRADLTAVRCPMVQTGEGEGARAYEPAENAFDTAELIGMKLAAAREQAAGHGCEIIVALEDGKGRPVPIEVDPSRIYVFVERNVVTYIEGVGGGL
jgi:hypothetical protein